MMSRAENVESNVGMEINLSLCFILWKIWNVRQIFSSIMNHSPLIQVQSATFDAKNADK